MACYYFSCFRPERRRVDSGSKRRELTLRNTRGSKKVCLTTEGASPKKVSSTSSCESESDICDSNESLANLGEIEDSVDSPPHEKETALQLESKVLSHTE